MSNDDFLVLSKLANPKPTRDQIINVQSNFCNLRDSDDIPIFTPFITSLLVNNQQSKADDWIARLKNAGSTHIDIGLTAQYNEDLGWNTGVPGNIYPIPSINLIDNLPLMIDIINEVIDFGMIPHLHLSWDDNGYDWGVANIPRILTALSDFTNEILWNPGWDGCFPSWSPSQIINAINIMRSVLGPSAQLATEFAGPEGSNLPYIDLGHGEADYNGPLQELDCLLLEYGTNQFYNECGMQQQMTRLFNVANYPKPLIPGCDAHSLVYYLSAPRPRGRMNICAFEWVWGGAYNQIRKINVPNDAKTIASMFKGYGFSSFGNGQS